VGTDSFIGYWKRCVDARLKVGRQLQVHDILYRDLVTQPDKAMRHVMAFVGLDFEARQLNPANADIDGRVARKEFRKLGEPINDSSVDRWRQVLSEPEVARIERLAHSYIPATASYQALSTLLESRR